MGLLKWSWKTGSKCLLILPGHGKFSLSGYGREIRLK